jgi:hypothetical protein
MKNIPRFYKRIGKSFAHSDDLRTLPWKNKCLFHVVSFTVHYFVGLV